MIRYRCEKCGSTLTVAEEGESLPDGGTNKIKLFRTTNPCALFPHNWRRLRLENVTEKDSSCLSKKTSPG